MGWRSAVATGTLEDVTEASYESSAVQGLWAVEIPEVDIFERPPEEITFREYRLDPKTLTGEKRSEPTSDHVESEAGNRDGRTKRESETGERSERAKRRSEPNQSSSNVAAASLPAVECDASAAKPASKSREEVVDVLDADRDSNQRVRDA
nr:hypothetical protein [Haloprofundus sp. MHR1]